MTIIGGSRNGGLRDEGFCSFFDCNLRVLLDLQSKVVLSKASCNNLIGRILQMAFKSRSKSSSVPDTPDQLFRTLPRRIYPAEMPHQRAILQEYANTGAGKHDVALQLPTGSGKTLVGLMIAEWRRRKNNEKVVYLCPTRQLVNQTVEQASEKYGLDVVGFVGSKRDYSPSDVAAFKSASKIAVTTYSSVFNTNPFFYDADTLILDDAHSAENYIGNLWTLRVEVVDQSHRSLHAAIASSLQPHISRLDHSRLVGRWSNSFDANWVDKVPTPKFIELYDEISAAFEAHVSDTSLEYPWGLIRNNLQSCHLYLSSKTITIRPLLPPTWTHSAFSKPQHRVYMSATLGEGGDLERLTGREKIHRIPVPEGFELQGVGRRFFMFPGMSLIPKACENLRLELMGIAGRSVALTPSKAEADSLAKEASEKLKIPTFDAKDIENSKDVFTSEAHALAALAGRFDGIDFPMDECRFLCVHGLPRASNEQENFLMSKMGASALLDDRVQTRVMQAIGRCTRSLQDSSAVFITGSELQDYLVDKKRREYFFPELQAEISFGVDQSMEMTAQDFIDNFSVFLENGQEWASINDEIVSDASVIERTSQPEMTELAAVVSSEIKYLKAIWAGDFVTAFGEAKRVLSGISHSGLKGYRALWHYLAGSAAYLATQNSQADLSVSVKEQFRFARNAAQNIPWLSQLTYSSAEQEVDQNTIDRQIAVCQQIENVESFLISLGTTHEKKFVTFEKAILEGLHDPSKFEEAQKYLGTALGFSAENQETSGAPDPFWICGKICVVFEDYVDALPTSSLSVKKARQVASHPTWIRANAEVDEDTRILPVLVAPITKVDKDAFPHLEGVYFWSLVDFQKWAAEALATLRELRNSLSGPGDLAWRAQAQELFTSKKLSIDLMIQDISSRSAQDLLS